MSVSLEQRYGKDKWRRIHVNRQVRDVVVVVFASDPLHATATILNAGDDKKLGKKLMRQYSQDMEEKEALYNRSGKKVPNVITPLGPAAAVETQKTLILLISCLNATYAAEGYDFSSLTSRNFEKLESFKHGVKSMNMYLERIRSIKGDRYFVPKMWTAIDNVIEIKNCAVYRFIPNPSTDPFAMRNHGVPTLWSMNYLFYNKDLRRIIYVTCSAIHASQRANIDDSISLTPPRSRSPSPIPVIVEGGPMPMSVSCSRHIRVAFNGHRIRLIPCARTDWVLSLSSRQARLRKESSEELEKLLAEARDMKEKKQNRELETKVHAKRSNADTRDEMRGESSEAERSWTHEIATCDADHVGEWTGKWEECAVKSFDGDTYTVICRLDGKEISGVKKHLVRQQRDIERKKHQSSMFETRKSRRTMSSVSPSSSSDESKHKTGRPSKP